MDTIDAILSLVELRIQGRAGHTWRQSAFLFMQYLRTLSIEEAQSLAQSIAKRYSLQDEKSDVLDLLVQINMFVPGALASLLPSLVSRQQFYPGQLYLGAGEEICQQVLSLIHTYPEMHKNHLLITLAWIGSKEVQERFSFWRHSPPDWRSELFVSPEDYSFEAGWELTEDGKRRDLYYSTCFELIQVEQTEPFKTKMDEQCTHLGHCSWCQRPLRMLLDLELDTPQCRWISAEGERMCIAFCTYCSFYETTYMDISLTGEAHWSKGNGDKPPLFRRFTDDGEMEEWSSAVLSPGSVRRTPFEAIGRFLLDEKGISQIGGHPEWIHDAVYPRCPSCQRKMLCLGQVALEDWYDMGEGIFYIFLCLTCRITATHYQQT